jgi:hypothetical protein
MMDVNERINEKNGDARNEFPQSGIQNDVS